MARSVDTEKSRKNVAGGDLENQNTREGGRLGSLLEGKLLTISHEKPALDLKCLCERLRGTRVKFEETDNGFEEVPPRYHESWHHVPDSAYDLLYKLLDPDPSTRITADDALEHDFIKEKLC
ncbi:hypothetical protein HPB51_023734 [Rhipicephalus microplus]|uniref:Uncharacterized protein n=1 Tax=Rhipicephalus microplus TaxID=6941 RepID=A0A9J6EJY6_RHIMP|nr:hypothetical protein HPB51_023734 [Rhipicephalus microplus]